MKYNLVELHARNFVHAKMSLRARCVVARHRARNLLSPANHDDFQKLFCKEAKWPSWVFVLGSTLMT